MVVHHRLSVDEAGTLVVDMGRFGIAAAVAVDDDRRIADLRA